VSITGSRLAASASASIAAPNLLAASRHRASSSAPRSGARVSTTSSTSCTSVPNAAPAGRSAIGDGTARSAAESSIAPAGTIDGSGGSSWRSVTSGSLATPGAAAAAS
jgi:hypothetical protein